MTKQESLFIISKNLNKVLFNDVIRKQSLKSALIAKEIYINVYGQKSWIDITKMINDTMKLDFYTVTDATDKISFFIACKNTSDALMWVENHMNISNDIRYDKGFVKLSN